MWKGFDIDYKFLVIERETPRKYNQKISARGKLTIPLELREKIHNDRFYILKERWEEKIILAHVID